MTPSLFSRLAMTMRLTARMTRRWLFVHHGGESLLLFAVALLLAAYELRDGHAWIAASFAAGSLYALVATFARFFRAAFELHEISMHRRMANAGERMGMVVVGLVPSDPYGDTMISTKEWN